MSRSAKDAVWAGALFWARFGITAMIFLVMARWISPSDLGSFGAAFALIQILQAVQTSGVPEALIAKDDDDLYDTGFWLSVLIGAGFSVIVFGVGVLADSTAADHNIGEYIRYFSCIPFMIGLGSVSEAKIRKERRLNILTLRTTATMSTAGGVAISLAYFGYGGLALVAFTIINNGGSSLLNLLISRWKPGLHFSMEHSGTILRDATFIGLRNVVKSSINPVTQLIVNLVLGPQAGGFYLLAVRLVNILSSLTLMPAQYAALPFFMSARGQEERGAAFIRATSIMGTITAPIYVGVASVAPIIVEVITGSTSSPAAALVQGLLFHSPVLVLTNLGIPALVSAGKAREAFSIVLVQALLNLPISFAAAHYSLSAVGWSYGVLYYAITPYILRHISAEFQLSSFDVIRTSLIPWACSLAMGGVVLLLQRQGASLSLNNLEILVLCGVIGAVIYTVLLWIFAPENIKSLLSLASKIR